MGNGKTYQFTLTKAVPKGGQIVWNGAWDQDPLKYDIKTYASPTSTTVIETVKPTEGTGGTELTTLNSGQRMCYGSNNYKESAVREWLNSDKVAGSVWTPATNYDRPPSWVSNKAGFMNGMDADFLAVIGKTTFGIEGSKMDYWTGLVINVQNLLRNWKRSDENRYK